MKSGDKQLLLNHTIDPSSSEFPTDVLHLYVTNAKVDSHNMLAFLNTKTEKLEITAQDSVLGIMKAELCDNILNRIPCDPRKTMQLHTLLQVSLGLRYEISVNIRNEDGLTNGAGFFQN